MTQLQSLLNINIKKGLQELDGKNAHDFLRWRHNNSYKYRLSRWRCGKNKRSTASLKELYKPWKLKIY